MTMATSSSRMTSPGSGRSSGSGFREDAAKALASLRLSLHAVTESLPEPADNASALARALGLNRKIAWQVWRIIEDDRCLPPAQVLPGRSALEGFLRACGHKGVPESMLNSVRVALRRFDDLALLHGGDRASLMSLLRQSAVPSVSAPGSDSAPSQINDRASESVRRQAFLANSEIWGVQTRAYFAAAILAPGGEPGRVDDLSLAGEIGVRRLRDDAVRVISGLGFSKGASDAGGPPAPRALVSVPPDSGLIEPMVPRFTSARVRVAPAEQEGVGQTRVELMESPVGRSGDVDFVLAQFCPNVGRRWASDEIKRVFFSVHLFSAYAACVHDLIVHRDLWPAGISPTVRIYSGLRGLMQSQARRNERDILPIRCEVRHLGSGLSVMRTPHVPNFLEIVDWACGEVGWKPEEFEAYRCMVMYPPQACSMVMAVELPEDPAGATPPG